MCVCVEQVMVLGIFFLRGRCNLSLTGRAFTLLNSTSNIGHLNICLTKLEQQGCNDSHYKRTIGSL